MKISTPYAGKVLVMGQDNVYLAVKSKIFKDWIKRLDKSIRLESIYIQSVDTTIRHGKPHVIFIKLKAKIFNDKGVARSKIIFLRGGSVAILMVMSCRGQEDWTVVVEGRMPGIGGQKYCQIPAGMMDDDTDPLFVAQKEMKEETSVKAKRSELVNMTKLFYGKKWPGIYPSPGACDEFIHLFLFRRVITTMQLALLADMEAGLVTEHEKLTVRLIPLHSLCQSTPDVKAHSAYMMYLELLNQGILKKA